MDRNFYDNDDFEDFLKQKADQHKMYPSDRVWNNIYSSLHGRKRWLITGFVLLFVFSSLFIGRQAVLSNYNHVARQINKVPASSFMAIDVLKPNSDDEHRSIAKSLQTLDKTTGIQSSLNGDTKKDELLNITRGGSIIITTEKELAVINNAALLVQKVSPPATDQHSLSIMLTASKPDANTTKEKKVDDDPLPFAKDMAAVLQTTKRRDLSIQFYASPIVSYRRLYNDGQAAYAAPVSSSYGDNINKYVHHKPAIGFEAGTKILYKLSNSLSVYAGAQLNYSRYYVDAYKFHVEKASIALNDSRLDTLSGYTDIRNFSGYSPEQLQNQYWQLSVPLGVEIKLLGNKKLQLNVAGGIQPTFLVHSNSYLISSDYKNYIQSPDMARSFNVHTNFEAFLSYQTGGIKWQLGPQFRSQLLSSYSTQYRVREYLTEFGIKFGITKSLR